MTSDPARLELHVTIQEDPPARLDKALARDVPESAALSRSRIAKLLAAGDIRRGGEVLSDPSARVRAGDVISVRLPEAAPLDLRAEAIPLDILYEDADLLVIDKPAGMVVHPAPGTAAGTLVNALLFHCGDTLSGIGGVRRPGIVHRIDKDTSGLLVVAKSDRAHHGLSAQFAAHSVIREYRALAHGVPDAADPRLAGLPGVQFEHGAVLRIATRLDRHRSDRQRQAVFFDRGRHAVTRARVMARFGTPPALSLLSCVLETGRTHQIRVHLAHVGHALVGDQVYGGKRRVPERAVGTVAASCIARFPRQALHAAVLGFTHPVSGREMRFERDPPSDMTDLIAILSASGAPDRPHHPA